MRALLPILLAGCMHATPNPSPAAVVVAAPPSPRAATAPVDGWLDRYCNACHDGDEPSRPRIGGGAALSSDTALRSAMMLGAQRMPPKPGMSDAERRTGVTLLCRIGAEDPALCIESALGARRPPLVAPPRQVLDELARRYPGKPTPAAALLEAHAANARSDAMRLDPTQQLLLLLLVEERCPSDDTAFERCAGYLLARSRFSPPEPLP